jgi:hypothetical protein
MKKLFSTIIVVILVSFLGCSSSKILKPLSYEERYPIRLDTLIDLTGAYNLLNVKYDTLFNEALNKDFVYLEDKSWGEHIAMKYPNPFISTDLGKTVDKIFSISGDVEIIDYKEPIYIQQYIPTGDMLSAIFGAMVRDIQAANRGIVMVGFIQYRLRIQNAKFNISDTLVIRGFSAGPVDKFDRRTAISDANRNAACQFIVALFTKYQLTLFPNLPGKDVGFASNYKFCQPPNYK